MSNEDLMTAIMRLPQDHYVKIGKEIAREEDEEEGAWFLSAAVLQKAPRDGWPSRGACHRHPPDWPSHQEPCPVGWRNEDTARFGVSASVDEPEVLERLLIAAILKEWP